MNAGQMILLVFTVVLLILVLAGSCMKGQNTLMLNRELKARKRERKQREQRMED